MTKKPAAAPEWKKLNDFTHVRARNEMYLGSRDPHTQVVIEYVDGKLNAVPTTWVPAVFTAFREVLDNALDEVVTHGHGNRVDITYDPKTMVFSVRDNGRGIPIAFVKEEKAYEATILLSQTKAGRNFDERGNSRGMNGIGASAVNYCSEYFILDIVRDKKSFSQRFCEGDGDLIIEDAIIFPAKPKDSTGTRVEFKLSDKVFPKMILPESFIRSRIFEIAVCYPNVKIYYNGNLVKTAGTVEKSIFAGLKPITFSVREEGFNSQFWLLPNFMEDGSEISHALVNAIPTYNGGTQIDAFKKQFFSGLLDALASTSKRKKLNPNRGDVAEGMLVFNITEMDNPSFDSQNKTRLINESCAVQVKKAMDDPDFFKKVIRTYPDWIERIYERCAARTQKKDDSEAAKAGKKNLRVKIAALSDACGKDRSKCTLFLAEGLSAVSGIVEARDPEIHGALPLRGKVLNVHGVSAKTILDNEAIASILNSVGLVPGQKANRMHLRYGKVYIACDADPDGGNIAALLINVFYQLWPELFDPNQPAFIYCFETPLIIASKGKTKRYWYADNYTDFDPSANHGFEITRAKGLAALKRDDWKYCLENPKAIPITDDGNLSEALNLLFNKARADDRKSFIGL